MAPLSAVSANPSALCSPVCHSDTSGVSKILGKSYSGEIYCTETVIYSYDFVA